MQHMGQGMPGSWTHVRHWWSRGRHSWTRRPRGGFPFWSEETFLLQAGDQSLEVAGGWFLTEGRERGEDIVGFYHSHPDHPARWSATDLAEAHWFGCSYLITSVEKGTAMVTNSFELVGSEEKDKRFADEEIEVR